jgi:hypothetical protein
MDEITLFRTLQPAPPPDPGPLRQQARSQLDRALRTTKPGGSSRASRKWLVLAGVGAVAMAACAAIIVPVITPGKGSGSFITSAWAVQRNPDGSVAVTFKEVADPAGLQRALRADGIQARVMSPPTKAAWVKGSRIQSLACNYPLAGPWFAPARTQQAAVTWNPPGAGEPGQLGGAGEVAVIHPSAMPSGSELFVVDAATKLATVISRPAVLKSDRLPPCRPVPVP